MATKKAATKKAAPKKAAAPKESKAPKYRVVTRVTDLERGTTTKTVEYTDKI
jgi:hypothetical protein